jgi:hypothetical protein|tara:strand:- start:385 stop:711 length:327 start_codon:yes stop_codon:yes gene_type:complete
MDTLDEMTQAVREHGDKHFHTDTCCFTDFQCDLCGVEDAFGNWTPNPSGGKGWEYIGMAYTDDELRELVEESKATTSEGAIAHISDVMHSVAQVHAERAATSDMMWRW